MLSAVMFVQTNTVHHIKITRFKAAMRTDYYGGPGGNMIGKQKLSSAVLKGLSWLCDAIEANENVW